MSDRLPLAEKDLQRAAIDVARMLGWRVAHFRPAMTKYGWKTPVAADGAGFPDLLMVRGDRVLVRELKVGSNKVSEDQLQWLESFRAAGIDAAVWTDKDLPTHILEELK